MKYKLKKTEPEFEAVDGPMAGRKYSHGKEYTKDDLPPGLESRFVKIKTKKVEVKK